MSMMLPGGGFAPDPRGKPRQPMTQPPMGGFGGQPTAVGTPFNKPPMPMTQPPMGGFGGPVQPGKSGFAGSDFSGRAGTGFGGPPPAAGTPFNKPPMPMTQPPMGGFGGPPPMQPGMGQQGLPFDVMQRLQQFQQMMPQGGQQPQKPVSAARQFLDARQQYLQGGSQGARPRFAQFQQQQLGGMGQQAQPVDRQKQLGGGYSPGMQDYYAQDAANQAQRSQMMQFMQQQQEQGGQQLGGIGQQQPMPPQPFMGQPMQSNPMQQQQPAPPPPMRMNMGGSVDMPPPNPYEQQVGQEDPRMQAMRNMQQMNFGG